MRNSTRAALAAAGTIVLVGAFATPALAAPSPDGDTAATVTVTGGGLSITVPATATLSDTAPGQTATATVTGTTVTDTRAGTVGWDVSYSVLAFTDAVSTESIPLENLTVTPGAATATTGVATFEPAGPTSGGAGPVFSVTGPHGNNSATWDTELSLLIPEDGLAGTYTTTFTQSVTADVG